MATFLTLLMMLVILIAIISAIYWFSISENTAASANTTSSTISTSAVNSNCVYNNGLPDRTCTPGAVNYSITENNINTTICLPGYTTKVRHPTSYTTPLKAQLMIEYGFNDSPSNHELDHLIPLEIGGAPRDPKNLWPEPWYGTYNAGVKDRFENYLKKQVCSYAISLQEAQNEIADNWILYWNKAGNP